MVCGQVEGWRSQLTTLSGSWSMPSWTLLPSYRPPSTSSSKVSKLLGFPSLGRTTKSFISQILHSACYDPSLSTSSSWFGRLESCGWLTHVSKLLEQARRIALAMHSDGQSKARTAILTSLLSPAASSVVVHGAMSRDATLQLTSLSQLLLDYRCRTMAG